MALEIEPSSVSETVKSAMVDSSSDDDEPMQIKRTSLKKRINLSDDESDTEAVTSKVDDAAEASAEEESRESPEHLGSGKKKTRRVVRRSSDSEDSDPEPAEERSIPSPDSNSREAADQQRQILQRLRGSDDSSSEDERPVSRRSHSSASNRSDEDVLLLPKKGKGSKANRPKPPPRKSATACRKAMEAERLKIVSESQRMVRESRASLPYHKPRQRSLKEFLEARAKPSQQLRGTRFQRADITAIAQELEAREKQAEEFFKAASDESEEEERFTPPPPRCASGVPGEERVLRVLLTTPEDLEKNLPGADPTLPEDSQATQFEENQENLLSAPVSVTPDVPSKQGDDAPVPDVQPQSDGMMDVPDTVMDSEPMEIVNDRESAEVPETPTLSGSDSFITSDSPAVSKDSEQSNVASGGDSSPVPESTDNSEISASKPEIPPDMPVSSSWAANKPLPRLSLCTELTDACLTPSDALEGVFLKPAPKLSSDSNTPDIVEDSVDTDDFKLEFEDSEDTLKGLKEAEEQTGKEEEKQIGKEEEEQGGEEEEEVKAIPEPEKPRFNLTELYNSGLQLFEGEEEAPKVLTTRAKVLANLKAQGGPVRLKGRPDEVIDLDEGTLKPGASELVQRFLQQAGRRAKGRTCGVEGLLERVRAGQSLEESPEHKSRPGEKMKLLKSELQRSIAQQRDQEFRRRQLEYQMYENETEGIIGEDLEEEGKLFSEDEEEAAELAAMRGEDTQEEEEEEGATESEPELEDDVPMEDAPRVRSKFVQEEAEESEPEETQETQEQEEEKENEEEESSEEEEGSDGEEEVDDPEPLTPGGKRKFSRIVRVEDSDDEPDPPGGELDPPGDDPPTVPAAGPAERPASPELLDQEAAALSEDQEKSFNNSMFDKSLNLSVLEPPLVRDHGEEEGFRFPQGITQLMGESGSSDGSQESAHFVSDPPPRGLDVLVDSAGTLEDLGDLCSGQFPESAVPSGLDKLLHRKDSLTEDLADLCSGKFPDDTQPPANKGLKGLVGPSQTQGDDLAALCSGKFPDDTQPPASKVLKGLVGPSQTQGVDLAALCSGQFVTQASESRELNGLLGGSEESLPVSLTELCSGKFPSPTPRPPEELPPPGELPTHLGEPSATQAPAQSEAPPKDLPVAIEMRIVSDDEEEEEDSQSTKLLKKKKKRGKRKLDFSDDEEEDEADAAPLSESDCSEGEEGGYVDYDSEENEVRVAAPRPPRARPADFLDEEAELSESEWGSADEDERHLDELEEELGDHEHIDQRQLEQQLGKIHARRMLDEDKRDVRLFQEAFLEDGDLHEENGGRQRLFRWKNTAEDGEWANGAGPAGLSGDEGGDEDEEEEQSSWRMARLERETWLAQNKEKAGEVDLEDSSQSSVLQLGRSLLAKMLGTKSRPAPAPAPIKPPTKSPSKAVLQELQRKSGSFLSRRSISLVRMAALAGGESETTTLTASSRNFVFSTISPSSSKSAPPVETQDTSPQTEPAKKRPARSRPGDSKPAAKKQRVSSSIFQHLL